jgi:hypothetical protein
MDKRVSCDLFCKVVDNYGDAGVCWRLARQLAGEQGWRVRLWIDDLAPLTLLDPAVDGEDRQRTDGIEIRHWTADFPAVAPADVVVEAFACELPAVYLAAMAQTRPVWVNLEYLSAEEWVAGCHGMTSPHATLPLVKHFFFPGFVAGTGGLLRGRDACFEVGERSAEFTVSLFCYDNPALPGLFDAWRHGAEPLRCLVADGLPRRAVARWLGRDFAVGDELRRDRLTLVALPFLPQPGYDRLLASCDLDFVRGEDSFVRAQWARRPFVWQAYPQAADAHHDKLDAFLALYTRGLEAPAGQAAAAFFAAWNGKGDAAAAWPAFRAALPALADHAEPWAQSIAAAGDLAENLARFCLARL